MKFTPTEIADVLVIEPKVFSDARGGFFEQYREDLFKANGIADRFVQDNHSFSVKGVLRGLHYQIPPKAQSKLVFVVRGEVFDVALDLRRNSKTFGRVTTHVLSAANRKMLFIPKGFAHGFLTLSDEAEFIYKVSDTYSPEHERGVLWSDPDLKIQWPDLKMSAILSEKDRKHPTLKNAVLF